MTRYPEAPLPKRSEHAFLDFMFFNAGYQRLAFDRRGAAREYTFKWSNEDDPYLRELRSEFGLDKATSGCMTDYEIALALCKWVSMQWAHSGQNEPLKRDAISIMRAVRNGKRFRCVEYSIVLQACLAAYGIKARTVGLQSIDIETIRAGGGHVVVEAYLKSRRKWAMLDAQNGVAPTLGKVPLNSVELQNAISRRDRRLGFAGRRMDESYIKFIFPYLFYFDAKLDNRIIGTSHMGGPKRTKLLVLAPLGYKKPMRFQRVSTAKYPIRIETHSIKEFYPRI